MTRVFLRAPWWIALFAAGCTATTPHHMPSGVGAHAHHQGAVGAVDESIPITSTRISGDDAALFSYVKRFGLAQTITRLNELTPANGDCHQPAHQAGRMAYEIYGVNRFDPALLECHAGGLHGVIEAFFQARGVADLAAEAGELCGESLNWFTQSQCLHGIGHGLMAWSGYELSDALAHCDLLEAGQDACYTGVFMENIVGSLATHHTDHAVRSTYVSNDPHYPCTIVSDKYKTSCYMLQTSRMLQLFGADYGRIATACGTAPAPYQMACYSSMGRDIGGLHRQDAAAAIRACAAAPPGAPRTACLTGAVQDAFWDPGGEASAVQFCRLIANSGDKEACYGMVIGRARQMLSRQGDLERFCRTLERDYQDACLAPFH